MISEAVCVLGFSLLIAGENPKMEKDTRYWIATNLCAAANDGRIDPQILGAYLLNENRKFDLWAVRPGVRGNDHGLFQINAYYQQDRAHLSEAHHPYYGAVIAASIIQDNLRVYGWSWKAFAAYWSPGQAQASTDAAKDYYHRFARHFEVVGQRFEQAEYALSTPKPPAAPLTSFGGAGGSPPLRASQRTNK
jgi:hypothetical protein